MVMGSRDLCRQLLILVMLPGILGYITTQCGSNINNRQKALTYGTTKPTELNKLSAASSDISDLPEEKQGASSEAGQDVSYLSDVKLKQSLDLLKDSIAFNSTAASRLLDVIKHMRENQQLPRETVEEYLDNLLDSGPDARLPIWSRPKLLGKFSTRARMYSLRRALDLTTPPSSDVEEGQKDETRRKQRRRRALLAVLNSIAKEDDDDNTTKKTPIIVKIERKAKQASREVSSDLRSRLPEGLESPKYKIIDELKSRKGCVEIRRYDSYSVCSVSMVEPRPADSRTDAKLQMPEMKGASAFGALAGYLFGKNDQETAMKMTTPVFTGSSTFSSSSSSSSDVKDQQMEFVLPSTYWSSEQFETAPQPLVGSGVTLQRKDGEDRAVLMFGGYASKKEVTKRKQQLRDILAMSDSTWRPQQASMSADDDITVAQYNDPFTVPWRRLNEVSLKVVKND